MITLFPKTIACYYLAALLFVFSVPYSTCQAQVATDSLLAKILSANNNEVFREVLGHPDTYRLQIIYTVINREANNRPVFKNYYFHYDPALYFNPASMVKMPLALLSLEKINTLHAKGVKWIYLFTWRHCLAEKWKSLPHNL